MKRYEIWTEGYQATGQAALAKYWGSYEAASFEDACLAAAKDTEDWEQYYSPGSPPLYWGCRFFDNEVDARASFG